MKTLNDVLEEKVGERHDINYNRLSAKFAKAVLERRAKEARDALEYENGVDICSVFKARQKLSEELAKQHDNIDGSLPICSVNDALLVVKRANVRHDLGVNNFETYLMKAWRKNNNHVMNAAEYLRVKDYFTKNYPKSKVSELIDKVGQEGYFALPVRNLIEIASRIETQDDYDFEIRQANLEGNSPNQTKSREFILAIINGESE